MIEGYNAARMDTARANQQWFESPSRPPLTPPDLSSSPTPPRPRSSFSSTGSLGHLTPLDYLDYHKTQQQHRSFDGSSPLSRKSLKYSARASATGHHQQLSPQFPPSPPLLPILTVLPAQRARPLLHKHSHVIAGQVRGLSSPDARLSAPVAISGKPHDQGRTSLPTAAFELSIGVPSNDSNRQASLDSSFQGMAGSEFPLPPQHSHVKGPIP